MHITETAQPTLPTVEPDLGLRLLGPSTAMSRLWSQLRHLAPHIRTLLLTGPPDAGQDAAARLLLDLSSHPRRPFLVWKHPEAEEKLVRIHNFAPTSQDIFLFLPDVDELSLAGQNCLLRLIRTRRARNFSVVAAAQEDLRGQVSLGRFSAELADMLQAVRVALPPLQERTEDLPMLLGHMVAMRSQASAKRVPHLSDELLRAAMEHPWTANFRELGEVADALVESAEDIPGRSVREMGAPDLHRAIAKLQRSAKEPAQPVRMVKLDTVVHEHIHAVLKGCRGNKQKAAETLGISRSTLYRMLDTATQSVSWSLAS